ncbi:unnamed protein product [Lota lota]
MADGEEIDPERSSSSNTNNIVTTIGTLKQRFQELHEVVVKDSTDSPIQASSQYCQDFCRTLLEYAGCWKVEQDPVPLVEVYTAALLAYSQASAALSPQCDNVPLVLERLALSFVELLLSLKEELPASFWKEVRFSVQRADARLQESGIPQLSLLCSLTQQPGVWASQVLQGLLSRETQQKEQVAEFLELEGPVLLEMRLKQLMKEEARLKEAEALAQACAEHPAFQGRGHFKQTHLICLCSTAEHDRLMEELSKVDCRDALEMICNLESEGEERVAFSLCSAFLTHQLLQADTYCAWELTLFWSKLLKRLESSEQDFLDRCRKMSMLSKTVFHILFLIKVVQSEMDSAGLPTCIEMCIMALQLESSDRNSKATICKTLSCLLSNDLEVKRACQLTEFLLEPTVDAYYAVESLYNEPDQKVDEDNMPVPNSLRCELLLVFKTQWPFDPEFWDWRALKRQCLALMGEEASIVSSIDLLNDNEDPEGPDDGEGQEHPCQEDLGDLTTCFVDTTNDLDEITDRRQKNREIKRLRQKGFVSARFRNFQAYMQYCVLCDKEFLGHRIVRHAQTHFKAGVYSCPICAETFTSKDTLLPHVASHVKQSSNERLTAMKTNKKLANPKTAAPVIAALKAKSENYLHTNGDSQKPSGGTSHTAQTDVSGFQVKSHEENVCPVSSCKKSFKFLKNLLAHVKAHGDEEAKRFLEMQSNKVVCQYCRRQFVNVTHLNDHLQVHCGVKPYICIQLNCKASFQSNPEFLVHRKSHGVFKARCMFSNCGKIFNEAFKLYDHEAQHYKTFTCKVPDCGKLFHSQTQLELHQEEHATETTQEEQQITQHNSQQSLLQNPEQNSQHNSQQSVLQNPEQNSQQNSGPSLIERMLSNSPSSSLEISHESKDFSCANVRMCQTLPTSMTPLPPSGIRLENAAPYPVNPATPSAQQRHHCAFENCTRNYSSYRSVTKHMRAVHPEFYDQWKIARRNQTDIISNAAKQQTSMRQHSLAPSSVNQGETKRQSEQDVKKRLREQILSGDFLQRSSVCHSVNPKASASTSSKSSGSFSSTGRPSNINSHSACARPKTVGDVNGTIRTSVKQEEETGPTNVEYDTLSGFVKPFACDNENCTFRAMSSDVLWKHMFRVHNSTLEMINQAKQRNAKLAPFGCHKCNKTFTRNSNRRVHYQTAHRMSIDEISKLHIKPTLAPVVQSPVSGSNWSDGQHRRVPATPTRYSADRYGRLFLQSTPGPLPSSPIKSSMTMPLEKSQITKQTSSSRVEKPIPEAAKKLKGKKSNAAFNPYRPYCCVHEGCAAAFTVQHNLILHYRAIHQSALSVLEVNKEQDGTEAVDVSREPEEEEEEEEEVADSENEFVPEFRCQEKDCCRVFQEVPSLLQHYLQLHEFSLDKAGAILSRINLGQFACDQQRCVVMFTSFWKYVGHIKEVHGGVTLSRHETLNGFSCDVEDCDRTYATKYNLLRHMMKKHPETYQLKVMNQPIPEEYAKLNSKNSHNSHYPIVKAINGKENIQSNKKLQKVCEKKRPEKTQKNNWTKYGKPSLKSKGEASALCTKKFTLQYPCMLTGCESVMRSERSVMKHYIGHGLSERYLEEQRSHFIFCKKFSRYKHRSNRSDDSKSDNSSDLSDNDLMADTGLGGSGYRSAKPGLRKRAAAERSGGFFDGSTSDEDSDSVAVSEKPIVVKRKRGRPRKLVGNVKAKPMPRSTRRTRIVYSAADEETDSCDSSAYLALTPDDGTQLSGTLTSFKPMGFEVSFLKFLEHSTPPQQTPTRPRGRPPGKKSSLHTKDTSVEFSNRQNFESLGKVRIVVDGAYSVVAALLLKQLQDMRPTVILEKND